MDGTGPTMEGQKPGNRGAREGQVPNILIDIYIYMDASEFPRESPWSVRKPSGH